MTRFIDFDAAWAEAEAASEPLTVQVLGRTCVLPASLPVKVVLFAVRHRESGGTLTMEFVIEHLGLLVGDDVVQQWIDDGIEQAKLFEVYLTVTGAYRLGGDAAGEATPPETGASPETSSKAGRSSKPTGSESTGGT